MMATSIIRIYRPGKPVEVREAPQKLPGWSVCDPSWIGRAIPVLEEVKPEESKASPLKETS